MRKITFILFLLFCGLSFGQTSSSGNCPLEAKNKAWVTEFKSVQDRADQVDLVVRKIIADGYDFDENLDTADLNSKITVDKSANTENCSIRFGLVYGNNKGFIIDLKRDPDLEELIMDFTSENIDKIDLNEYHEKDIYKAVDIKRYGVVMYTDNKEIKKKIRRWERNKN